MSAATTDRKHPLDSFFAPSGIAIIGASRDLEKIPGRLLSMLRKNNYPGRIYPINPNYGEVYRVAGDHLARNYRFDEAVEQVQRAIKLDPDNTRAYSDLGTHLLRTGDEKGARVALERAFKGDAFDQTTFNQLDLLDTIDKFVTITDGDIIIVEGGTTATAMAPYLADKRDLTVVTNGLATAEEMRRYLSLDATIMCAGGILRPESSTFVGPLTEAFFREMHAHTLFLSATGLTLREGVTDPKMLETQVKRAMVASAGRVMPETIPFGSPIAGTSTTKSTRCWGMSIAGTG